jgi:hypothetical protein
MKWMIMLLPLALAGCAKQPQPQDARRRRSLSAWPTRLRSTAQKAVVDSGSDAAGRAQRL